MLTVEVLNRKRSVVGKLDVRDDLLEGPINRLLMSDAVRALLSNQREGNASTKTRAEVSLTNKKIYKQKGTGNARHSSRKAPTFVGGGTVFGPHPREFRIDLPRKMRLNAFLSALRLKWREKKILVVGDLVFKAPKTRDAVSYMKDLAVSDVLFVLPEPESAISKSTQNIPHVRTTFARELNLLDLFKRDYMVCTPEALKSIEARLFGGE